MNAPSIQGLRYRWKMVFSDDEVVQRLYQSGLSLSYPVLRVLASYGYASSEEIEKFLFAPVIPHLHNAQGLKDIDRAVERIQKAIIEREKILIVGDYDVDGITATSLVLRSLLELGALVNFFIPNRFVDGYGLSTKNVDRAAESGYRLVITVDNGITAVEAASRAKDVGIDLIITDHHMPHDLVPEAYAIVNPRQIACSYPSKELAGVGVAYKLIARLYEAFTRALPESLYELIVLGTIADVVPLIGENRSLVRYALHKIRTLESPALSVLKANARIDRTINSQDIGFFIAPQLNALGRLEDPRDGVFFLLGEDFSSVERIGKRLYELNQRRKEQERLVFDDVQKQIAHGTIALDRDLACIATGDTWPAGVIGLAAARISQLYGRPTFLLHRSGEYYKGSCRSVQGVDIFSLLSSVSSTLVQFGGHAAAAGLSVRADMLSHFSKAVQNELAKTHTVADLVPSIRCVAPLFLDEINGKLMRDLGLMEPFGSGNDRPLFFIEHVQLVGEPQLLKDEHVKCMIVDRGIVKPVIFFNRPELYEWLLRYKNEIFDLAAYVQENTFRGRITIDLQGVDICQHKERQ